MFNFLKQKNNDRRFKAIAKKQLRANKDVLRSLRDYDEGKKKISTVNVKRHLSNIQTAL